MLTRIVKKSYVINQYYFYRLIFTVSEFCSTTFFYIFLYTQTQSLSQIISYSIVLYTGLFIGYVLGGFIIEKVGYVGSYKIGFFLLGSTQIFLALSLDYFQSFLIAFALISGIARGIYWSSIITVKIKEFGTQERGLIISNTVSIALVLNMVLPPIIGAYLTNTGDYSFIFLIGGMCLLASIFVPWKYNKKPQSKITKKEIRNILKNKYFINYGVLAAIKSGLQSCIDLVLLILPFILLKSELGVGLLVTIFSIASIFLSFIFRKSKLSQAGRLSKIGNLINSFSSILFLLFWGIPGLLFRGLGNTLGDSIKNPAEDKIESRLREIILKKNVNQSIIELNFLIEVFTYFGRFVFLSSLLIFYTFNQDIESAFKGIIAFASVWGILYSYLLLGVNKKVKKASTEIDA